MIKLWRLYSYGTLPPPPRANWILYNYIVCSATVPLHDILCVTLIGVKIIISIHRACTILQVTNGSTINAATISIPQQVQ